MSSQAVRFGWILCVWILAKVPYLCDMILVGIDTGKHTGFAAWDTDKKCLLFVDTLPIHQAIFKVESLRRDGEYIKVIFEDARQRKWIPRESSMTEWKGRMQGAGSVKRDATIWEEYCKDSRIPYEAIPPRKGMTKWSAESFKRVTGWTGRTSEHGRDAAMLVYGR